MSGFTASEGTQDGAMPRSADRECRDWKEQWLESTKLMIDEGKMIRSGRQWFPHSAAR